MQHIQMHTTAMQWRQYKLCKQRLSSAREGDQAGLVQLLAAKWSQFTRCSDLAQELDSKFSSTLIGGA